MSSCKEEPPRSISEEFAERTHLLSLHPQYDLWTSIIPKFYLCFFQSKFFLWKILVYFLFLNHFND